MIWVIALLFHVGLVLLAYRVGRDNAAPGVALFFVGVIGFQLVVNGPASFLDGGCDSYGHAARDC